jgi:hypothetical protein
MKNRKVGGIISNMNTILIDERVALTATEFNHIKTPEEIKLLLEQKLKEKYEGRCHTSGYIQPGSLRLLGKSMGIFEHGRFTGNIIYDCRASCNIYIPIAKSILKVKIITDINEAGAYSILINEGEEQAMRILIPRDMHLGNPVFDTLKIGMVVSVELLRTKFKTNEPYITGVAVLHIEKIDDKTAEKEKEVTRNSI